jgi:hypothetical protein
MKPFTLALLLNRLAVNPNTRAQNAAENSRQQPTIEDRLTQLEQKQDDLAGRVDALEIGVTGAWSLHRMIRSTSFLGPGT